MNIIVILLSQNVVAKHSETPAIALIWFSLHFLSSDPDVHFSVGPGCEVLRVENGRVAAVWIASVEELHSASECLIYHCNTCADVLLFYKVLWQ